MVDCIKIQKIGNGYIVSSEWHISPQENTCYFVDMDDVCKHLDKCFGSIDRVIKEKNNKLLTSSEE